MATNWQEVSEFPVGTPDITLVFRGLMALCQRTDNNYFQFGCFGTDMNHKLSYSIDAPNQKPGKAKTIEGNVEFSVERAKGFDRPAVYQSANGDNRDFSHVIDLEEIHGRGALAKRKMDFTNIITIKSGILYTIKPTTALFEIRDSANQQIMPPRQIAFGIGINIYLAAKQTGILEISGQKPIVFEKDGNQKFIRFGNECGQDFDAFSPDLKLRNDFHLNYQHIIDAEKNNLLPAFLSIVGTKDDLVAENFGTFKEFEDMTDEEIEHKTLNPCGAYGFGNTGGW